MKRVYFLIIFFLLGFLFLSINFISLIAVEDEEDNDDIDDDIEELNKRKIELTINENEVFVESFKKSDERKDVITTKILLDKDGIIIENKYGIFSESESKYEYKIEFGISFRDIIEFIDEDENGIFNPEYDPIIQNMRLDDFSPIIYETSNISGDSKLHYLKIQTKNEIFKLHFYFVEEFAIVENSLISPNQMKIEVEISNFDYFNESSQLSLYTRLESEEFYYKKEITEDEKNGFAKDEECIITSFNNYTGYFTWQEKAWIDNNLDEITVSSIIIDEGKQNIYFNYPIGKPIFHSFKLGIEEILVFKTKPFDPTFFIILFLIIGALSISAAYVAYYHVKHKITPRKIERDREEYFNERFHEDDFIELYDKKSPLQILYEENSIEKLSQFGKVNITVFSEDFFDVINRFDWEANEKKEFIREMRGLSPFERRIILKEMLRRVESS